MVDRAKERDAGGVHLGIGASVSDGEMQRARRDHGHGGLPGEQDQIQGQGGDQGRGGDRGNSDHEHRLPRSDRHAQLEARQADGNHGEENEGEPGGDKADKGALQGTPQRNECGGRGRKGHGQQKGQGGQKGQGPQEELQQLTKVINHKRTATRRP